MRKWFSISFLVLSSALAGCVKQEEDGVDEDFQKALASFPETMPEKIVSTSVPLTAMLHSGGTITRIQIKKTVKE